MSRTTTPRSYTRAAVSAGSPSGTNETSVAWPGAVTTRKRSDSSAQQREEISAAWRDPQGGIVPSAASRPASDEVGIQPASKRAAPSFGVYTPVSSWLTWEKYVGSPTS